jgi:hypothetical protein
MATSLKAKFKTDAIFIFAQFLFVTLKVNILFTPSKHWSLMFVFVFCMSLEGVLKTVPNGKTLKQLKV